MKNNLALENILIARETRDALEAKLLLENKTLITVRANYPGSEKNTIQSHAISYFNFLQVIKKIHPKKILHSLTSEGLIFFILTSEDTLTVKRKTISIEENFFLGRLADIDVRTKEKNFSRSDLNLPERKCLVCNERAVLCVRSRSHSVECLLEKINTTVAQIFTQAKSKSQLFSNIVRVSMLEELCREYSFGCVNANHNGSHRDMDFLLMLQGIEVIAKSIKNLKRKNAKDFHAARQYGKHFEKKLIETCGGVNTYKGIHFLFLVFFPSVLNCKSFAELQNYIANFSKPCLADLNLKTKPHNLKKLGIRGEAVLGFEDHFKIYLPSIESGISNTQLSLKILTNTFDTTTIKRGGLKNLKHIQALARNATRETEIKALDNYCIENNLSTGGVADNFILSYAIYFIKKYWYGLR